MSDSSSSSPAGKIDRVFARLAFLAPGGRFQVFFGSIQNIYGLEAFAVICSSKPNEQEGFDFIISKSHKSYNSLGSVIEKFWLGLPLPTIIHELGIRFCVVTAISKVVGLRICGIAVPGMREYYFQRQGLRSGSGWRRRLLDRVGESIMSFGGTGAIPVIGATAASALVCCFGGILQGFLPEETWYYALSLLCILATLLCCLLEGWARKHYFAEDPREVVLDEVAGMSLALLIAGPGWLAIIASFFAFRFFDIFKLGIHWIEKRKTLGTVVWDDLLAGLYAGLLIKGSFMLLHHYYES